MRTGYWPSPKLKNLDKQLTEARKAALELKSLDLIADLHRRFPDDFMAIDNLHADREFIFVCARAGFADALATIPANHPILSIPWHAYGGNESLQTLMNLAVESGSLECVKLLHELGAPVNDDVLESPLHCAIGDVPKIKIARVSDDGCDDRYYEESQLHIRAVKLLAAFGADVDARYKYGRTAAHDEASRGHEDCVQVLRRYGADVNSSDRHGMKPVNGTENRYASMILRDVFGASDKKRTPLADPPVYTAIESNDCELLMSLVESGGSLRAPNYMSKPLLHAALAKGNAQAAVILLTAGADPNEPCCDKYTALHWLAHGHVTGTEATELLARMLERGVDVNARGPDGATALHYAAESGTNELLLSLLRTEGNKLDVVDRIGWTWADQA
ncbi:hypothetical protein HDU96_002315, partial [Phlyctochytrium bullatum]